MSENNNPFENERVESLEQNNEQDPYRGSNHYDPSSIEEFTGEFSDEDEIEGSDEWVLSGRITRINEFGDFVFYDLDDRSDSVQIMCTSDDTELYEKTSNINMGDRVVFIGYAERSNTGELTLFAEEYEISAKALNHIADEYNQFSERRQITHRTGALTSDDELYDTVQMRFEIQNVVRQYLNNNSYLEFDTPLLHNQPGGAEATPFVTNLEALDMDVYLRIAPELYLKRLITAGYGRVYEIGRCFRNEDIDTTHNPEFTMLELYEEYADYEDMMDLTENLYIEVAEEIHGSTEVEFDGEVIDVSEWDQLTFDECIEDELDGSLNNYSREDIVDYLEEHNIEIDSGLVYDELLMEIFEELIEDELTGPVFVTDYPTVSTPLCQTVEGDDSRVQRFEAFIAGIEVGNSYTELTNPVEQRERLIEQADGDIDDINDEFVEAISYGMPPTAGLGIGVDRLAMVMTDSQSIKSVLPFPMSTERR